MNTRKMLAMNGRRQPQDSKEASGSRDTAAKARVPMSMPTVMPVCGTEPKNPRRLRGAYS